MFLARGHLSLQSNSTKTSNDDHALNCQEEFYCTFCVYEYFDIVISQLKFKKDKKWNITKLRPFFFTIQSQ